MTPHLLLLARATDFSALRSLCLLHQPPQSMADRRHGVAREGDAAPRIIVHDRLPQRNLPFMHPLGIRQIAATVSPADPLHQPVMLAQQPFHAHLAASLCTEVTYWPFRGRSVYTGHDIPPVEGALPFYTLPQEVYLWVEFFRPTYCVIPSSSPSPARYSINS